MTDKELLYIKTVAEKRNVTRAAEALHIAQPSLTQTLRRVEGRLGCELFSRGRNGVELTEAGRVVYEAACEVLRVYDAALKRVDSLRRQKTRALTVGASWYSTLLVLTGVVTEFSRRFPQVQVQLVEKNSDELLRLLRDGAIDAALVHEFPAGHPENKPQNDLRAISLFDERFCVACHEKYDLDGVARFLPDGTREIDLAELRDVPVVVFSSAQRVRRVADYAFSRAGVVPRASLTTYGFPSAAEMVCRGAGAVLMPELYARRIASQEAYTKIRLYRIPQTYAASWTLSVCLRKSDKQPDSVRELISMLRSARPYA